MTTVDTLLLKFINAHNDYLKTNMSKKDFDTLMSLGRAVSSNFFITENQSKLIVKILQENIKKLPNFSEEISNTILEPQWSKVFRQVEQVKKLYITNLGDHELVLTIEFTHDQQIRKILQEISKNCENLTANSTGKKYTADLTEKNIIMLVEALSVYDFDIDEKVKNHYDTIKSWSHDEIRNQFLISKFENSNFQKAITADLGIETSIDQNIINDRSVRYQYFVENPKNPGETLVEYIANRPKPKIWVDKKQHSLLDVFQSIIALKRFPVMIVFDTVINNKYLENLEFLSETMEKLGIDNNVGVYFRLDNDDVGKKFNKLIADKQYNTKLTDQTKIVAVSSGKIPKFFIKNSWRPMCVIGLDTKMGLRHGKTSVYSNCCDLIIEYSEEPAILVERLKI